MTTVAHKPERGLADPKELLLGFAEQLPDPRGDEDPPGRWTAILGRGPRWPGF
jgi:hypothetical protein